MAIKKPVERKKKKASVVDLDLNMDRNTRHSSRKNTMLNRILVEDQIREQNKRKVLYYCIRKEKDWGTDEVVFRHYITKKINQLSIS